MKLFFKTLLNAAGIFALVVLIIISVWNFGFLLFRLNTDISFGSLFPYASRGILNAVPLAMGIGLLFGLLTAFLSVSQRKVFEKQKPVLKDEALLHDGPANHFLNHESVGGWLYLTDKRLFFRSHKFNIQPHEWSLQISDIINVQANNTLGIIPRGLEVTSKSGKVDKFVVYGNRHWSKQILSSKAEESNL